MKKVFILLLVLYATLQAQREPVLKQIDLPHPYYYREMYLPQLTSGPSWVTWSPDSKEVIYSMAGSLWRQKIDSGEAVQLTDGPGYDYQPDWSHDGKYVAYTKYHQDAMELWLLELASGKTSQLTKDGAVNVEPRWSPDGKRIAYVSTALTKHFHIFLLEMDGSQPKSIRQLTKENVSTLPRYYYSKFDHEISPAWSPDGKDIIFISNHGHIHGTGGIWRATVPASGMIDTTANAKEIHSEETNWKARPDFSPDGKRIAYASYLGRQWHQLWLMPSNGGDVFPLTYGDYDNINPRCSPDGKKIASISNEHRNTDFVIRYLDGPPPPTIFNLRSLPKNLGLLNIELSTRDMTATSGRLSIRGPDSRDYAPRGALVHADDSFDRSRAPFERHYFHSHPNDRETFFLPADVRIQATKGLGYAPCSEQLAISIPFDPHYPNSYRCFFRALSFSGRERWLSGDLHVHMNYAGAYRTDPKDLVEQIDTEDVNVAFNLLVNKEQRFPDAQYADRIGSVDNVSTSDRVVTYGQEFHTSYWGHLGLLNIKHLIIPGYAGYPNTAAASLVPMDADVADMAHAQNKDALVGWVHPFDEPPDPYKDAKLTNELPVDVALGKIDYYEVLGFSDHKSSAAIWYRLLNLGFRLPAGAGTDAMTNFASLRGPVGLNRVYVQMDDPKTQVPRLAPLARNDNLKTKSLGLDLWLRNLKAGKTFATNGPLFRFSLGGQPIGGEVKLDNPGEVPFTVVLRSIVPVDKVEVVCNGSVVRTIFPVEAPLSGRRGADQRSARLQESKDSQGHTAIISLDVSGTVPIAKSGWCVLRAYSDHAEEPIMDIYPYGTTSPIYVTVAGEKPGSPEDAKFFSKWIERVREDASVHPDYNTPEEREHVLRVLDEASRVYADRQ